MADDAPSSPPPEVVVIGAGLVGLATARALLHRRPRKLTVVEAEDRPAAHQSGNNSGVMHSGLYYRPGSLKAQLCSKGRKQLEEFCDARDVAYERCGKVVVATDDSELDRLTMLEQRGRENGLTGIERLGPDGLRDHEPHVRGVAGLFVPETGIVDFPGVARALVAEIEELGGTVMLNARVQTIQTNTDEFRLATARGEVVTRNLVNCGGLQADRLAVLTGVSPGCRIVPFRGEYKLLAEDRRDLCRTLIYPVPDPRFPFLGVHFTRRIDGTVEAGPNAVLATHRHGYRRRDVSLRDLGGLLSYGGFWRMGFRYWRTGIGEWWRSLSHGAFTRALQKLVPDVRAEDLKPGGSGVRAQALDPDGGIADDYRLARGRRSLHVLSAPSPAATACLAIGEHLAGMAEEQFADS